MAGRQPALDPHLRKGPLTLIAAGAGLRRRYGTSTQPSGGGSVATSAISSYSLTPDLQFSFRNGLAVSMSLGTRSQRTENNGNATELDQDDLTGSVNYSFPLPAAISRARKQVRSTLTALSSKTLTCLEQRSDPSASSSRTCGGRRSAAASIPICSRR